MRRLGELYNHVGRVVEQVGGRVRLQLGVRLLARRGDLTGTLRAYVDQIHSRTSH